MSRCRPAVALAACLVVAAACIAPAPPPAAEATAAPSTPTASLVPTTPPARAVTSCGSSSISSLLVEGPTTGGLGRRLELHLSDGAQRIAAESWVQVRNPDRYVGDEYVSSSALDLVPAADGTLAVTARYPGRYKIVAARAGGRYEACVLVRPERTVPEIRGAAFETHGPLDRAYASRALATAKRVGMTWADIVHTGFIDFDTATLEANTYCEKCPGALRLDDLEWTIDEAHRQGLSVVVELNVWARSQGKLQELWNVLTGIDGTSLPWPAGTSRPASAPRPTSQEIRPEVLRAYGRFVEGMTPVAARHRAEALMVGSVLGGFDDGLLWPQVDVWRAIFAQVRRDFPGRLWMGGSQSTCPHRVEFALWGEADGIGAGLSEMMQRLATSPRCSAGRASGPADLTADALAQRIGPALDELRPFQLQATFNKPLIFTDLYALNVDGVSILGGDVYGLGTRPARDDQEIVDVFEAIMRTVGQRRDIAIFLWSVSLSPGPDGMPQDPLQHPALASAIANWWGP